MNAYDIRVGVGYAIFCTNLSGETTDPYKFGDTHLVFARRCDADRVASGFRNVRVEEVPVDLLDCGLDEFGENFVIAKDLL